MLVPATQAPADKEKLVRLSSKVEGLQDELQRAEKMVRDTKREAKKPTAGDVAVPVLAAGVIAPLDVVFDEKVIRPALKSGPTGAPVVSAALGIAGTILGMVTGSLTMVKAASGPASHAVATLTAGVTAYAFTPTTTTT